MISDDERAFLRRIADRPGDDAPRLIFADWLDDRDDPRGEMIRLQLASSRLPPDHADAHAIDTAIQIELPLVERLWQTHLDGLVSGWSLRHGLPECITMSARDLARYGPKAFEWLPIQRVRLESPLTHFPQLCVLPIFGRIRELDLCGTGISLADLQSLSRVRHLKRLRVLDLSFNGLTNDALEVLARLPALASLVELSLNDNEEVGTYGIRAIAESQTLVSLRSLDLGGNHLGEQAAGWLAQGSATQKLDRLNLEGNPVGDRGLAELARAGVFSRMLLRSPRLTLSEMGISVPGLLALLRADGIDKLEVLDLSHNPIGDDGLRLLAHCEGLPRLRALVLRKTGISGEGIDTLAASPRVATLESLDLRDNLLTYDSVENLRERSARMDWRSPVEVLTSEFMLRNLRRRFGE